MSRKRRYYDKNIRRYLLYVYLRDTHRPILAGIAYTIKQLLEILSEWEKDPDFEGAFFEIED